MKVKRICLALSSSSRNALAGFREMTKSLGVALMPVSEEIAMLAAERRAEKKAKGSTLHTEDLFIGVTAAVLGQSIATQKRRDFEVQGIERLSRLS